MQDTNRDPILDRSQPGSGRRNDAVALISGILLVLAAFSLLEFIDPFYFVQDDNFAQFLPIVVEAGRRFFEGGLLQWTPFSGGGMAVLDTGVYSLTYPVVPFAYGIARLVGNEFYTFEVYALLHLVCGFVACHLFLRRGIGCSPLASFLGSLCFTLNGFFLIAGRSWYYMLPVAVSLPLLWWGVLSVARKNCSPSALLLLGAVIGIAFHAGNAQMWIYSLLLSAPVAFFALVELPAAERNQAAFRLVIAGVFGLLIASPLLLVQWPVTNSVDRAAGWGNGIRACLQGLFAPSPLVSCPHPNGWESTESIRANHLLYAGTTFSVLGLLGVFAAVRNVFRKRSSVTAKSEDLVSPWTLFGFCVVLLFAGDSVLGNQGFLWRIMLRLPVFGSFTNPFKFLPFVHLSLIVLGAFVVSKYLRATWLKVLLTTSTLGALGWHVSQSRHAFFLYADEPYPNNTQALYGSALVPKGTPASSKSHSASSVLPSRVYSAAPARDHRPGYGLTFRHNLGSAYGVFTAHAYDNFRNRKGLPKFFVRSGGAGDLVTKYGITTLVLPEEKRKDSWIVELFTQKTLTPLGRIGEFSAFAIADVDPLAFFVDTGSETKVPLPFDVHGSGLELKGLGSSAGALTLNFRWMPAFRVSYCGKKLFPYPDQYGRVRVDLETCPTGEGAGNLSLWYRSPLAIYAAIAALLVLALVGFTRRPMGRRFLGTGER